MRMRSVTIAATVLMMLFGRTAASASSTPGSCDRACLKSFMDSYIDALKAKTVADLPVTEDVKVTEDCKEITLGNGYPKSFSGAVDYRLDIIDVSRNGAFAFLVIKDGSASVLYAVRLKMADRKISQIETMVVKNSSEGMIFTPQGFKEHGDTVMTYMPTESELNTREEMAAMAVKYPQGLQKGGTFEKNGVPFTADAYRLENGQLMAGPGCTFLSGCENIAKQGLPTLSAMLYQVALVDEEAGIVLLRMNFGAGSVMGDNKTTLDVFESFKVYADSIHAVRAFMQKMADAATRTPENLFGWDYEKVVTGARAVRRARDALSMVPVNVTEGSIRFSMPAGADGCRFELYTVSGRCVVTQVFSNAAPGSDFSCRLPVMPSGCYIGNLVFLNGDKALFPRQFTVSSTR